jgi:hypothetical protein
VAEHLHLRMGSDEWKAAHVHGKVNEIVVLFSDATDMSERAVVERSKYETLEKSKQTYSYLMLEVGIFGRRERSCFCRACFGARGRGVGTTDSNLAVAGCPKATRPPFCWVEQACQRTDALGIAERRVAAQREGERLLAKLKPGMWLMSEDRVTGDTIWIGQAVKVKGTSCMHKKVTVRDEWIAGVLFGRNDNAIAVKWWVKSEGEDLEERTYEEWAPTAKDIETYGVLNEKSELLYFLVNSTELRMVDFKMDEISPPLRPVVPKRAATRRARAQAQEEEPTTEGRKFRIPAHVENQGLALCWK